MSCIFKTSKQLVFKNLYNIRMNSSLQTETAKRSGTKTNKCISLIALGNPEPGYKNTRHNVGRLIVNNMVNQLTSSNGVVPSFGSMVTMANINLAPGKKLTAALEKIYGDGDKKLYSIKLENIKGSNSKVQYEIFTPSLERIDGAEDNKTIDFNNNKSSFVFAYVDRTAMNLNGPKAIGFLKNLPTIIEKNVQDVDLSGIKFKNFIIADDKDVKFGATQLRAMDSSNRGHNGYHSCEKAAHKDKEIKYNKVSIGIGKPPVDESQIYDKMILADYVLDYFKPEELEYLKNETTEKVWDFLLKERN